MASNDIAVPDWTFYMEQDLREAIRQMDEARAQSEGQAGTFVGHVDNSDGSGQHSAGDPPAQQSGTRGRPKGRPKIAKTSSTGIRRFRTVYNVYSDMVIPQLKAAHPDISMGEIWKKLAIKWKYMSKYEKLPYEKEFQNRKRLYELENPFETQKQPFRRPRNRGFRFRPSYGKNLDFEVSRIEHLPHCPIAVKKKIYDSSVTRPYIYPRTRKEDRSNAGASTSSAIKPSISPKHQSDDDCTTCPRAFAVCDFCRNLGFTQPTIFHFEADCWRKAKQTKQKKYSHNGQATSSLISNNIDKMQPRFPSAVSNEKLDGQRLPHLGASSKFSKLNIQNSVATQSTFDVGSCFVNPERNGNFANGTASSDDGDLPDLSAIDDLLAASGLRGAR